MQSCSLYFFYKVLHRPYEAPRSMEGTHWRELRKEGFQSKVFIWLYGLYKVLQTANLTVNYLQINGLRGVVREELHGSRGSLQTVERFVCGKSLGFWGFYSRRGIQPLLGSADRGECPWTYELNPDFPPSFLQTTSWTVEGFMVCGWWHKGVETVKFRGTPDISLFF